MDEQVQAQLQQQQQQQKHLQDQIQFLHQQLADQKLKVQTMKTTRFDLTPNQIIRNFDEVQAFSGEDSYKLRSFLKAVEDLEELCGENNTELKQYCLKKLVNNKIIGYARNVILEIPEHLRTWRNVMEQLKIKFRPKSTIHQMLFKAKDMKVCNLKDCFNKLNRIKSECSEVCDFDEEDAFTYSSIDKEIVQILKSKLVPIVQLQVDSNKSLFELDNILCQTEIYLAEDIIKVEYKLNKDRNFRNNNLEKSDNFKKANRNYNNNYKKPEYSQTYNGSNNNSNTNKQNNYKDMNMNRNYYNNNNYGNGYKKPNYVQNQPNFNRNNNSYQNKPGQYQRQFDNSQYRDNNNKYRQVEPMEVDNIVRNSSLNQEVNFIEDIPQTSYQ